MERRTRKTGIGMWILLGVMIVAMGGFGLSSVFTGTTSTAALTIGDVEISESEFQNAYENRLSQMSGISPSDARQFGLPDIVVQNQVQIAALRDSIIKSDYGFSDRMIAAEIAKIPAFQDTSGKFDGERYQQILEQNKISERQLMASIRADLEQNLAVRIISKLTPKQASLIELANKVKGEARAANYISYKFEDIDAQIPAPDAVAVEAYYNENQSAYMAEPVRDLEIAYLIPQPVDATRVRTAYDAAPESYTREGSAKTVYILTFDTDVAAKSIKDRDSFFEAMKEKGLKESDIRQENMPLAELPEPIQNAKSDGTYGPVKNAFGFTIYLLEGIAPSGQLRFDEAASDIEKSLAFDDLKAKLETANTTTQDLIAGGATPATIATETPYELAEITSTETLAGVTDDPNFQIVLASLETGITSAPIDLENGGVALIKIANTQEPAAKPFADVRDQVRNDLVLDLKRKALQAFHDQMMAQISEGKTLANVAASEGMTLNQTAPMIFDAAQKNMPISVAIELFNRKNQEIWDIALPDEFIIAQVREIKAFDPAAPGAADIMAQNEVGIANVISNSILANYANAQAQTVKATINKTIIDRITGASK